MRDEIQITAKGKESAIPNSWNALNPDIWLSLVRELLRLQRGETSVGELRIQLLCDLMGWNKHKFRDEDEIANLIVLSEQLTFLFKIVYPDNNAALDGLTDDEYRQAVRVEPDHLDIPQASYLRTLDYRYQIDLCFFRQMLPVVRIPVVMDIESTYEGYRADLRMGSLTTSLTALQYIEARELLGKEESLPLLASILYQPLPYDSSIAHAAAKEFERLPKETLHAIAMNFEAVNNFLFLKTSFSLLTKFEPGKAHSITTDMTDALYDLSKDGLGNASEVEQLNVLTYLRILRKKTIDSVRQMHGMKMEIDKIASEVGLPIEIITKII